MEKYNLANEEVKKFEVYNGRNIEQMPRLVADGRVPMNTAQLMQRRLELASDESGVKGFYMNKYFDTGDAVVYHPSGNFKVVRDSQHLREMTPETPMRNGALIFGNDAYKALDVEEFKEGQFGKALSRADAKVHPVWRELAGGDQGLLNDYVDFIFSEYQARFRKSASIDDLNLMDVYRGRASGDTPEMRAWYVCGLGGRSDANGRIVLDGGSGRLLGIAPEAQNATKDIKGYTLADLQKVDKMMEGLEGILCPEVLNPLLSLRKKL